ncbi:MAG: hypothetical protein C4523_07225 [Myxococcales bacterium]|nr:MAG: hypothetical protein C4523_07225 [Myxococcales bacterium]
MPLSGTDGDTPDGDVPDGDVPDGDVPDGDVPVGDLCQRCEQDPDCGGTENYCMEDLSGTKFCARLCGEDAPCPSDYRCADIFSGTGEVSSSQCLPQSGYCDASGDGDEHPAGAQGFCEPCDTHDDCGGVFDRCLPAADSQTYCGTDCAHDQPCNFPNTYCKRISETVRQCWPISNDCRNLSPDGDVPDGDYPNGDYPDGDYPDGDWPDGDLPFECTFDSDCPPGQICDLLECVDILCSPCNSFFDCGSIFTECIDGGCATDCSMGSACPTGYRCESMDIFDAYCVPTSGSCQQTPDGDADGDTPDGDQDPGCSGPCSDDFYDCQGDGLCVCDYGEKTLYDCLEVCLEGGYAEFVECSYDEEYAHDLCWCSDETIAYCAGYTGSDICCTLDDPCDFARNDTCDCDGKCAWDATDCAAPDGDIDNDVDSDPDSDSAQATGACADPIVISSLPYQHAYTTVNGPDTLTASGCEEDGWAMSGGSGPERVYRLEARAGQSLGIRVESDFDAVLTARTPCGSSPDECLGSDAEFGAGTQVEELGITINQDFTLFITVDGYRNANQGNYTLTVEEN